MDGMTIGAGDLNILRSRLKNVREPDGQSLVLEVKPIPLEIQEAFVPPVTRRNQPG